MNIDSISQNRFSISVGSGINLSTVDLDDKGLDIVQFHSIKGSIGYSVFFKSGVRLSEKVSMNTRIMFFTSGLEYEFMDFVLPGEAFQDYSSWEVNTTIKEKGISISPGASYLITDNFFTEFYISYSRIFSSNTETDYLTNKGVFEVEGSENNSTTYNQLSSTFQIGVNWRKFIFTLGLEIYFNKRDIFFPLNFKNPTGREIKIMFGVAYNI